MKVYFAIILIFSVFILEAQQSHNRDFYVGTFTSEGANGIYLCSFNSETGDIELKKTFFGVDNPSFLKISTDKKYLYSVNRAPFAIEPNTGYVNAYRIDKNGDLNFLNKQISHGGDPCHIDVLSNGRLVAVANYGGGSVALYPVNDDGGLQKASSVVINKGSGTHPERQNKPYAHSVKFSPFGSLVFSADLGTDQLDIYTLDENKLLQTGQKYVKLEPGAGPRHFDFHPDGDVIYVINELNSTITAIKHVDENWEKFQSISTLPEGSNAVSFCADIHVSADGNYVYGSNRGHNSIAVFKVERNTKQLTPVGFVQVEGNWLRNFAIAPGGNFLLVANQRSGNITVFRINKDNGMPEFTGKQVKIPAPVCIEFL